MATYHLCRMILTMASKASSATASRSKAETAGELKASKYVSSSSSNKAATATTVFVRFLPASANIRRHHLEEVFSQIGPIRKSSVIIPSSRRRNNHHKRGDSKNHPSTREDEDDTAQAKREEEAEEGPAAASSYGFIKYTTEDDAMAAANQLDHSTLRISPTEALKLRVERASVAAVNKNKSSSTTTTSSSPRNNTKTSSSRHGQQNSNIEEDDDEGDDAVEEEDTQPSGVGVVANKTTNRLILRNLSFYATEAHVRKVMEAQFGKVTEVHIPQIPSVNDDHDHDDTSKRNKKRKSNTTTTHRGFGFVTFERFQDAQACLERATQKGGSPIVIQKRAVTVAQALTKTDYETNKQQEQHRNSKKKKGTPFASARDGQEEEKQKKKFHRDTRRSTDDQVEGVEYEEKAIEDDGEDMESNAGHDDDDTFSSDASSAASSNAKEGSEEDGNDGDKDARRDRDTTSVSEKRALFVRNLPFDATRRDLFDLFHRFGYITGIYLVKDRETKIPKGTAFVSFREQEAANKAVQATSTSSSSSFLSQREATENDGSAAMITSGPASELSIKGRRIFVNLALDKDTAATLVMEKSFDRSGSGGGKDRRNLYLKGEGRVDNSNKPDDEDDDDRGRGSTSSATAWDDLPEQDKTKRQRAWSDKNTKLRSPIFFINPTRLSIRNLDKQVDEADFKQLCVDATQRGLDRGLVSAEDMIAHWRASGEMTMRDIMNRVEQKDGDEAIIPTFDKKNVRRYIPSVFIDRDYSGRGSGGTKGNHPSRGFGFVEFENHAHALACLRELNNNTQYSKDYVAGGRHALTLQQKQQMNKKSKKLQRTKTTTAAGEGSSGASDHLASDGRVKVPRLIVEFTVENKAKARIQAEHREHQLANKAKQKMDNREKGLYVSKKKEKKQSRGARQRERKRKGIELQEKEGLQANSNSMRTSQKNENEKQELQDDRNEAATISAKSHNKATAKPPPKKKAKLDAEDSHFERLVASYEGEIMARGELSKLDALQKKKTRSVGTNNDRLLKRV